MDRADCRGKDLDLFFEKYETNKEVAKEVDDLCGNCPVRRQCFEMGVKTAGTGVHGGFYLALGHVSRARNTHKDQEEVSKGIELVNLIKGKR